MSDFMKFKLILNLRGQTQFQIISSKQLFKHDWLAILHFACLIHTTLPNVHYRGDADLFKEANDIVADLRQANNDIVDVDVVECGVVSAFSASLVQNQVPAVH